MKKVILFLLALLLGLLPLAALAQEEAQNLIGNGGFEQLDELGDPLDWYPTSYHGEQGYSRLSVTSEKAHSGQYAACVENASLNDARFVFIASVEENTYYRLSGYVLVESMGSSGNGANFAVEDIYSFAPGLFETGEQWQYLEWYGRTGDTQSEVSLGVRVGGYGAESIGKAYFDDMVLEKVEELPEGVIPAIWYTIETAAPLQEKTDTPAKSTVLFVLLAVAFGVLCALAKPLLRPQSSRYAVPALLLMLLLALGARIFLAMRVAGYSVDIGCFTAWSLRMAETGPAGFYDPGNYFCDYPPGYMLLLWPCGLLLKAMGAYSAPAGTLALLVVKSVPILFDLLGALLLFVYGRKRLGDLPALALAALYAFSPAALVNGAAWGQADSVLAFVILLCTLMAMGQKWSLALPLYTLAVLLKPQALLFAPVAGLWLLLAFLKKEKAARRWRELGIGLGASLAVALAVVVPFSVRQSQPVGWLVQLYGETLSSYAYATLNTANLYYLLAANWKPISTLVAWPLPALTAPVCAGLAAGLLLWQKKKGKAFCWKGRDSQLALLLTAFAVFQLGLAVWGGTYTLYGYGMMALVYGFVLLCMAHDPSPDRLPFYLALALCGIYLFCIKVHERYLFAALPLWLLGYIRTRDKRLLGLFIGFSITTFLNTAIVLDNAILLGASLGHLNDDTLALNVALCVANLLLCGYGVFCALVPAPKTEACEPEKQDAFAVPACYQSLLLSPKDPGLHLTGKDWATMAVVSLLYGVLAFANLGSTVAPQDGWVSSAPDETVVFELPQSEDFYFMYYAGVSYNSFSVSTSDDGLSWSDPYPCEMREGLCYRWNYALTSQTTGDGKVIYGDNSPLGRLTLSGRYLRLNAESAGLNLFEIALRDTSGNLIPVTVAAHESANPSVLAQPKPAESLIDEQDTCVGEPGWYTGTYFDEIYHARTAYEHLHGEKPYETTHPPLGKLMMAVGIAIFGMTPFGWRFAGALIGVLMLPALYLLAKQLFHRRDLAAFSMIAFSLDLMHYTQTRIATIDSFPVFFILLSYLCMVRYLQTDMFALSKGEKVSLCTAAFWKSLIPLALSGLFMGLSIASKWIGLYSAVGLAVLFFSAVYRQYRAGNFSFCFLAEHEPVLDEGQRRRVQSAQEYTLKRIFLTCGFCVVFFVLVPCLIYYLSYIPYLAPTGPVTLKRILQAQEGMLSYHSTPGLGMDHPFQSPWWQWPFILKPMWFAQDKFEPEGMASTIMCMGNPWVFYLGAVCMAAVIVALAVKHLRIGRTGLALRRGNCDLTLYVLVVGFAAQYLPWVLVPRSMYMYHYFASVPFIILATAWAVSLIPARHQKTKKAVMGLYLLGAAVFFILFFPYASGWLTSTRWLDAMKWFSRLYY